MNPMLLLDPDQMSKLESVLQSDEARNFLGEVGNLKYYCFLINELYAKINKLITLLNLLKKPFVLNFLALGPTELETIRSDKL